MSFFDAHKISKYCNFRIQCIIVLSWVRLSLTDGKLSRRTLPQCCNDSTGMTRSGNDNRFTCLPHDLNTLLIERSSRKSKFGQVKSLHNDGVSTAVRSRCETYRNFTLSRALVMKEITYTNNSIGKSTSVRRLLFNNLKDPLFCLSISVFTHGHYAGRPQAKRLFYDTNGSR